MVKEFDGDKALKEAKEALDRLYASPEDTAEFRVREKRLGDYYAMLTAMKKEGLEEGRAENQEKQKKVVLNMSKEGMSVDIICKITELSKEEVEKIIFENNS